MGSLRSRLPIIIDYTDWDTDGRKISAIDSQQALALWALTGLDGVHLCILDERPLRNQHIAHHKTNTTLAVSRHQRRANRSRSSHRQKDFSFQ